MNLTHLRQCYEVSSDRLLREQGKQYNFLTDRQFTKAREALSSKRTQLLRVGKGQKPNKALGLTETQIQALWDEKQLGYETPQSFAHRLVQQYSVFWLASPRRTSSSKVFFQIKCEDGPKGKEYVEWITERGSKTRTGTGLWIQNELRIVDRGWPWLVCWNFVHYFVDKHISVIGIAIFSSKNSFLKINNLMTVIFTSLTIEFLLIFFIFLHSVNNIVQCNTLITIHYQR